MSNSDRSAFTKTAALVSDALASAPYYKDFADGFSAPEEAILFTNSPSRSPLEDVASLPVISPDEIFTNFWVGPNAAAERLFGHLNDELRDYMEETPPDGDDYDFCLVGLWRGAQGQTLVATFGYGTNFAGALSANEAVPSSRSEPSLLWLGKDSERNSPETLLNKAPADRLEAVKQALIASLAVLRNATKKEAVAA